MNKPKTWKDITMSWNAKGYVKYTRKNGNGTEHKRSFSESGSEKNMTESAIIAKARQKYGSQHEDIIEIVIEKLEVK